MNQLLEPTIAHRNWLEISRGKSKFRSRPIHQGRFLIGAGSTCHLQLGGSEIPMLHSVIEANDDGLAIEAIVAHPQLLVNGSPRRSANLLEGDVIEIGTFRFLIHSQAESAEELTGQAGIESEIAPQCEEVEDVRQLSAAELVDRISEMEELTAQMHADREQGAIALLQAIRNAGTNATASISQPRLEEVVRTLSLLSDQVESQAQQFAQREQAWQQALFSMQDTQQRIISQLAQLAQAADQRQTVATRASA